MAPRGTDRRRIAAELATSHDGVVSRALLRTAGIDRFAVATEVRSERWRLAGRQTVAVHTGALSPTAQWWRAVWEVGRDAALDGVSALQAAGLVNFTADAVHVSVDHQQQGTTVEGVRLHRVRNARSDDARAAGLPRVRPEVATVRAAQWAASDRQAALVLCMSVQQRLVRAADLCPVRWPGAHYGRTELVRQLIRDVRDGAQSLGELDFAGLCRHRGLPEPSRQVVREGARGRIYLDVRWRTCSLVVEIDGAQHRQGLAVSEDNLRRNALAIDGETVLAIDLVGLRLRTDEFLDQVVLAHRRLS